MIQPTKDKTMSRTIKAIERHMIRRSTIPPVRLVLQNGERKFVTEWQQRVPETLSGRMLRKLRLAFAPSQSAKLATVNR
jgi:hypothetical protein